MEHHPVEDRDRSRRHIRQVFFTRNAEPLSIFAPAEHRLYIQHFVGRTRLYRRSGHLRALRHYIFSDAENHAELDGLRFVYCSGHTRHVLFPFFRQYRYGYGHHADHRDTAFVFVVRWFVAVDSNGRRRAPHEYQLPPIRFGCVEFSRKIKRINQ